MLAEAYVYIATSLDGFIARKNGDLDWLSKVEVPEEDYGYQEFMNSMDILVMGRNTYEKVGSFGEWPYSDKKVVILSSGKPEVASITKGKVEVKSGSPKDIVEWASKEGYKKIYVDGGKTVSKFLNCGLVKEMTISTIPILLGEGISLFTGIYKDIDLEQIETQVYSSGLIKTKYRVNYDA